MILFNVSFRTKYDERRSTLVYADSAEEAKQFIIRQSNENGYLRSSVVAHPALVEYADKPEQLGDQMDKGPWKLGSCTKEHRLFIESDDFKHDVRLIIDGDFTKSSRIAYAQWLIAVLNSTKSVDDYIKDFDHVMSTTHPCGECGQPVDNKPTAEEQGIEMAKIALASASASVSTNTDGRLSSEEIDQLYNIEEFQLSDIDQPVIHSYHDVWITTNEISRTLIMNLPFKLFLRCCRIGGWELWQAQGIGEQAILIAGEYEPGSGLRLEVGSTIIVDSIAEMKQVQFDKEQTENEKAK